MNYKAFTLIFFVLIFCLSTTTSSRRLLSGGDGSKMETQPHYPKSTDSATDQQPSPRRRSEICRSGVYGSCIDSPKNTARPCNVYDNCKRSITP